MGRFCRNCGKRLGLYNARPLFYGEVTAWCCSDDCVDEAFRKYVFINNLATGRDFPHDPYITRLSMNELREIKRRFLAAHEFAQRLLLIHEAQDQDNRDIAEIFREQNKGPWTENPSDVEEEIKRANAK